MIRFVGTTSSRILWSEIAGLNIRASPMPSMTFRGTTQTENVLSALCLCCPAFLTEDEHAKGRLEVQNVVNNFSEYERIERKSKVVYQPITRIENVRSRKNRCLAMK
jgi:hypothetical protein